MRRTYELVSVLGVVVVKLTLEKHYNLLEWILSVLLMLVIKNLKMWVETKQIAGPVQDWSTTGGGWCWGGESM